MTTQDIRRTAFFRDAAKRLSFHAVCLIGWEGPRPAYFGDNRGIWPVRAAMSKKELKAAQHDDLASPHVGVVVLEYVLVDSDAHAKRLKEGLDEVLLGTQEEQENKGLRHKWRDVRGAFEENDEESRLRWWETVLSEAIRLCGATEFRTYTADEAYQKTLRSMNRSRGRAQ